jgi:hypothetical protein
VSGEGKSAGINNDDRSIDGFVRILSAKTKAALMKGELRNIEAELKNSAGRKPWDQMKS